MERDFMGLNSKGTVVKEEALDECKEQDGFEAFNGSFVARTTEPWYGSSKEASSPAQLTIFYGGMVNVYDDITPEKAQAIMFLAGNGGFVVAASTAHSRAQGQAPTLVNRAGDVIYASQPINAHHGSVVSSPMSVSSHHIGPVSQDEAAKTMGGSAAPDTKMNVPRIMTSLGQAMQSAIPQARKASLARFLEKRKERMMASVPYNVSKNYTTISDTNTIVIASEQRE